MDIRRMKDDEKLIICRKYFYGGFVFLPLLWLMNAVWFFQEAFISQRDYPQKKEIKRYVVLSFIASGIELTLLLVWIIYFQNNRATSDWGDSLSFLAPAGIP
ncbi:gamma-secretase subunit pen-2-like [Panonychus citri]|uniref:gamma-secretase subunit pen-2-like n=1 Tax=Panonychus citri TaxID=50023 RepID=UPI002307B5BA|nr:gamma-secretase subunit pen-2-like [Panonychus citri]